MLYLPQDHCRLDHAWSTGVGLHISQFSVALALGACLLLRRSIGIDCSRKTTSQTLCASEFSQGQDYVSRYPQNLGHTLSPEKQVRVGLAGVRVGPRTQDKAERLMVSFVVALFHEPGAGAA